MAALLSLLITMKNWYRAKTFTTFFKQNLKNDAVLLVTSFATISQIANHCQISCWMTKFCYTWVNKFDVTRLRHKC